MIRILVMFMTFMFPTAHEVQEAVGLLQVKHRDELGRVQRSSPEIGSFPCSVESVEIVAQCTANSEPVCSPRGPWDHLSRRWPPHPASGLGRHGMGLHGMGPHGKGPRGMGPHDHLSRRLPRLPPACVKPSVILTGCKEGRCGWPDSECTDDTCSTMTGGVLECHKSTPYCDVKEGVKTKSLACNSEFRRGTCPSGTKPVCPGPGPHFEKPSCFKKTLRCSEGAPFCADDLEAKKRKWQKAEVVEFCEGGGTAEICKERCSQIKQVLWRKRIKWNSSTKVSKRRRKEDPVVAIKRRFRCP